MAAAPSEEVRQLFLEELSEAEEGLRPGQGSNSRRCGRVALGASLGVLAVVALAARVGPEAVVSQIGGLLQAHEAKEDLIKPFQQCGGAGWKNATCCQKGCACVVETQYYSQCKAPEGLDDCSFSRAQTEQQAAVTRVNDRKQDLSEAKTALKDAEKKARSAKKLRIIAEKLADKATSLFNEKQDKLEEVQKDAKVVRSRKIKEAEEELAKVKAVTKATLARKTKEAVELRDKKLKAAREAQAEAEKAAEEAQSAFEAADKAAFDKCNQTSKVQAHVDKFEADEKVRTEKKCGALFKDCTATNCCVKGCVCKWQNKYFGQCEGPGGMKSCDANGVQSAYDSAMGVLPGLKHEKAHLLSVNSTKAHAAEAAEKNRVEVTEKSTAQKKAARDEWEESTKVPAMAAKKNTTLATEEADKKIKAAKAEYDSDTATAAKVAKDAEGKKKNALKEAEERQDAEEKAFAHARNCAKAVTDAETALSSAKLAVHAWKRAAAGHGCGPSEAAVATI